MKAKAKQKPKQTGKDAQRAEFEQKPGMVKLDAALRKVLKVSKSELDRRTAEDRARRSK